MLFRLSHMATTHLFRPKLILLTSVLLCITGLFAAEPTSTTARDNQVTAEPTDENRQRTTLTYSGDRNIKVHLKGRAGNLELRASQTEGEGQAVTYFQRGRGYSSFDRNKQSFKWETSIPYTLNRLSSHIQKVAPTMRAEIPLGAELDFNLAINTVGYGSLDFSDLNISRFRTSVAYGDVDISFPTQNQSILRGKAVFRLMAGDLEINQLGNLKADKIKINGGVGELSVDFGPQIFLDTEVKLDLDIGNAELNIPRGTQVLVRGTSRDLTQFGFVKGEKHWELPNFHPDSPKLLLILKGPVGDLVINWM